MCDYIKREDAIEKINSALKRVFVEDVGQEIIASIPSADVAPVGHRYWIKISPAGIYECSGCGKYVHTSDIDEYQYCIGCGARMYLLVSVSDADNRKDG